MASRLRNQQRQASAIMLAARLHRPGDLRLHEEPLPDIGADGELLRVMAVGLCGSDRHWYLEGAIGDAVLEWPLVLGHEIVGVVDSGPRRGMRVVVDPADPCRECAICKADKAHLCSRLRFAGHGSTDGGLRTYMAWPARLMTPLPDSLSDRDATLLEPLGVALHAIDLAHLEPGMSAAVFGCGPVGLLLVQILRAAGCRMVFAADPLAHRVEAARELGAKEALPVEPGGTVARAMPRVEVAFDASGEQAAVELAIAAAVPGGRVVLVGIPGNDRTTFRASVARRKELTLSIVRRMRAEDLSRAIELAAARRVRLTPLITESLPLADVSDAFAALVARRGIKTVVCPA